MDMSQFAGAESKYLKVSVYVGSSIDGYIARLDGSIDWLNEAQSLVPSGEDCGYKAFIETVGALVMGRKTYEQVLTFGPWPYGKLAVVVLSRNPISFPEGFPPSVSHSSETPTALLARLSGEGVEHVYVDGGNTIQRFFEESLVDEITITTVPVAIGEGIPVFSSRNGDLELAHMRTKSYDFGFVQTTYSVAKTA
jgi:dihydrofolate reductase